MNTHRVIDSLRMTAKNIASAVAFTAGLTVGSVQAQTTTTVINLGEFGSGGTAFNAGAVVQQIGLNALPPGSFLRKVSFNYRLEAGNPYIGNLAPLFADSGGNNAVLMIVGATNDGNYPKAAAQTITWDAGGSYEVGATVSGMVTADNGLPAIDLHDYAMFLQNGWTGSWSGSITLEYDVGVLGVTVTTPADGQEFPEGTSVTASATVVEPGEFNDVVTFHLTPISPPGSTVTLVSSDTNSPFQADFGALAEGTYEIYASVINDNVPAETATSETHTFTVAPGVPTTTTVVSSANPSTYGTCTLTATVSPIPSGGTVTFYNNFNPLGSPVAVNTITGQATYNASLLGAGLHGITAEFNGFGVYGVSDSSVLEQTVNKAPLTVKALNALRAPNTANPDPFTYQITGYQNGQTLATSGVTGTPEITTTAILSSPPGDYPITSAVGTLTAANYSFTFQDGTLTVANLTDTFSVNFYFYPGWMTSEEDRANVRVLEGMPAGLPGSWYTSGWHNVVAPFGGGGLPTTIPLTSNLGSSSNFIFKKCRNGWNWGGDMRTTLLGDGNGNMMDGHVNATLDGDYKFDMQITDIPYAVYDVIFYMGANDPQYGDGKGKIVFNGGAEQDITVKRPLFDGTFIEIVDAETPGNYIVFSGVTGSSFTTQIWGMGENGFNHIGPYGFQIREATSVSGYASWQSGNGANDQGMDEDHDNDGVTNGIEYFLVGPGGVSTGFTPLPSVVADGGGTLSVTWIKGAGYTGEHDTDFVVETSTTLSGPWNVETEPGNVVVTPTEVIYTFPEGPPYTDKKFARLRVMGP